MRRRGDCGEESLRVLRISDSHSLNVLFPQHFLPKRKEVGQGRCLFLPHIVFLASSTVEKQAFFPGDFYPVYLAYVRTPFAFKG